MMETEEERGIPDELKTKLADFDTSLTQMESVLQPLLSLPQNEIFEKLYPLDRAKVDLVGAYTINSLFWMYMNVCGLNPKEHGVKQELDRIRSYMNRVKECQDKAKAPKLDKGASKRFVKSALWQAAKNKHQDSPVRTPESSGQAISGTSQENESPVDESERKIPDGVKSQKRKSEDSHQKKKKKKKDKNK